METKERHDSNKGFTIGAQDLEDSWKNIHVMFHWRYSKWHLPAETSFMQE